MSERISCHLWSQATIIRQLLSRAENETAKRVGLTAVRTARIIELLNYPSAVAHPISAQALFPPKWTLVRHEHLPVSGRGAGFRGGVNRGDASERKLLPFLGCVKAKATKTAVTVSSQRAGTHRNGSGSGGLGGQRSYSLMLPNS